jgi:hypothetical protein
MTTQLGETKSSTFRINTPQYEANYERMGY